MNVRIDDLSRDLPLHVFIFLFADRVIFYVNQADGLADILEHSAHVYELSAHSYVQFIKAWVLSFTVVSCILVFSFIFSIVRSHIWKVEENKVCEYV